MLADIGGVGCFRNGINVTATPASNKLELQ